MNKIRKITFVFVGILIAVNVSFGQEIVPQEKKGKWGYVRKDNSKKFVVKAKFEEAKPYGKFLDSSRAFVRQKKQYGVIDQKGKWLIKPNYDTIFEQKKLGESYLLAKKNDETFFLNSKGEIISVGFKSFEPLNKEIAIFSKNKQFGLIQKKNEKYETILAPEYESLGVANFANTLFFLKKDNQVQFYEQKNKKFSEKYDKYTNIRVKDSVGSRNRKSFLVVEKEGKKGLIDENFNQILPIEYNQIARFRADKDEEILFEVRKQGKIGIVNASGKIILPAEFDLVYYNHPYLTPLKNGFFGCYNLKGEQILNHIYEDIRFWKEQNAFLVSKDKQQGLVSLEEKVLAPIVYQNLFRVSFQNPCYILATKDKEKNLLILENNKIDKIHKEGFDDLRQIEINPSLFIGKLKNKENIYSIENRQLKKSLKAEFDRIEKFNKDYYWVQNKAKKYLLDKKTEKLIPLPEYTLIKDGGETYEIPNSEKLEKNEARKYAPEGIIYLEQNEKAFLFNPKTQELKATEKIQAPSPDKKRRLKP
jgi:hypothetical protein